MIENKLITINCELSKKHGGARAGAGRKPIGITRKISLTLPEECWDEIDRCCGKGDYSVSEVLRSIIEDNLHKADLL
ncbi:ribbon-helix-helix domain-containing protein [Neobacillus mesonae]|nr:ribbon-helix-helix domain-containing protein [Neobacillus mesonae]